MPFTKHGISQSLGIIKVPVDVPSNDKNLPKDNSRPSMPPQSTSVNQDK